MVFSGDEAAFILFCSNYFQFTNCFTMIIQQTEYMQSQEMKTGSRASSYNLLLLAFLSSEVFCQWSIVYSCLKVLLELIDAYHDSFQLFNVPLKTFLGYPKLCLPFYSEYCKAHLHLIQAFLTGSRWIDSSTSSQLKPNSI